MGRRGRRRRAATPTSGRGRCRWASSGATERRRSPFVKCRQPSPAAPSEAAAVLWLILILLIVWVVLIVLVTAWSMWFQSFLYTEPSPGLVWRGPAAASAVMAVVFLWVILDYR